MPLDIWIILALVFTGLGVSLLCSMVGLGGGVLFIPFLIIIYGLDPEKSIGTSIFCMSLVTLSATIGYYQNKLVDWKLAVAYDVFDIPGIILGAWITTLIPSVILEVVCGIAIIIIASMVIFKKQPKNGEKNGNNETSADITSINEVESEEKSLNKDKFKDNIKKNRDYDVSLAWKGANIKWVILSSFFGGLVTGMVGLGGGTVDTTTMVLLGVPMNIAAGSSSLAMLLTNAVGFASHATLGNVMWDYALPMGLAAFVGAQIGSRLAPRVNGMILKRALGFVALATGIRLLF